MMDMMSTCITLTLRDSRAHSAECKGVPWPVPWDTDVLWTKEGLTREGDTALKLALSRLLQSAQRG